jgi:hypothetical protein
MESVPTIRSAICPPSPLGSITQEPEAPNEPQLWRLPGRASTYWNGETGEREGKSHEGLYPNFVWENHVGQRYTFSTVRKVPYGADNELRPFPSEA